MQIGIGVVAAAAVAALGCSEAARASTVGMDEGVSARCGAAAAGPVSRDDDGDGGLGIVLTIPFALAFVVGLRGRPRWGHVTAAGLPRTVEQPTSVEPRRREWGAGREDARPEPTLLDDEVTRRERPPH